VRVLYVSHTGVVGGAEWSLLELMAGMRERVDVALASPAGELAALAAAQGVRTFAIRPVPLGFRVDTVATARGVVRAVGATIDIAHAAGRSRADLVHANSVRAGIAAIGARAGGAPAPLVHVRDTLPDTALGRTTAALVRRGALLMLANSHFTATHVSANGSGTVRVVYNGFDLERYSDVEVDREEVRRRLGLEADSAVIGVVAQLTPWKGQDDAIRTLALVRKERPSTHLVLVGEAKFRDRSTSYDNISYEGSLRRLAERLGVADAITFLGERRDVPTLLHAFDIVLVPSRHEPFGRSVVEAMAAGTPVIATRVGGPSEVIADGESGLLLPPATPDLWAKAVLELLGDHRRRASLAAEAVQTVRSRFGRDRQHEQMAALYREALSELGRRGVR
jgi:glycosyltransferase involved in cell wall biosynthesis